MRNRFALVLVALALLTLGLSTTVAQPDEANQKEYVCDKCSHQFPSPTVPTKCPKCGAKFGSITKADGSTSKTKAGEDRETLKTALMAVGGLSILVAFVLGIIRFLNSQKSVKTPSKKGKSKRSRDDD